MKITGIIFIIIGILHYISASNQFYSIDSYEKNFDGTIFLIVGILLLIINLSL